MNSNKLIEQLNLLPHPEGGYYKETYRSKVDLVNDNQQIRQVSTSIYYLLEENDSSHFHRIQSDELWYFHQGAALEILYFEGQELKCIYLGNDIDSGEVPQAMIPANTWFASHLKNETGFALVSCSVAPGFSFEDFELAKRTALTSEFPTHKAIIEKFTTD
ncbi:MAG TPA: cupin domain-containing protein [Flavobacteriales bacterium]|nr:cupin domain-containing protein [Flavobacteriales bacterium]